MTDVQRLRADKAVEDFRTARLNLSAKVADVVDYLGGHVDGPEGNRQKG